MFNFLVALLKKAAVNNFMAITKRKEKRKSMRICINHCCWLFLPPSVLGSDSPILCHRFYAKKHFPMISQHRFKLSETASSAEKPLEFEEQRQPTKTDQPPAYFLTIFVLTLLPLLVYFLLLHRPIQIGHEKQEMNSRTASSLFSVVYVTVPSMEVGKRIARDVVGQRLAACVNIVPQLTSIYEWKGRLEEDAGESMLIIKTGTDRLEALKQAVLKSHPYDVPEFISLPIEHGSEPYLKWIREQTSASSTSAAVDATPIDPTTSSPMEPTKAAEDGRGKPS